MRKALIIVQEQQLSQTDIRRLDSYIKQHYQRYIGTEKLLTIWNRIPAGQAFTKYEDSRSSLVTMECEKGLEQAKRVAMMKALEKDWLALTAQHPDELMLAVVEEDLFAGLFESSRERLDLIGRLHLVFKMLCSFLKAALSGAPIQFNPNL
ncbi:MAG: hypothetical protein CMN80_12835 [Spongiibacter sp.]|uniref:hypothetical protein n=1 Tax=Spongiibacter sp. TaxID=2024860 RepID=UPI000C0B8CE3|nr:hypothetical protein [Spongiibacter sp.]MAK45017.1 hypothetical protein [Spongiibacter sp.]|tara:strand:- start:1048 stop:1500 length:453 start_codon:yes stop_codon:yes gene_type:complete